MKKLLIIQDSLENKISYYHLAAFLVVLPFDRFYSEIVLISFLLHTLIHLTRLKLKKASTLQILMPVSVFLIGAIGLFYSQFRHDGLKDLEKQLAIILFPLALACCGLDVKKYLSNLLLLFSFTCVLTVLYLYGDALRIIIYNKLPLSTLFSGAFINHNFLTDGVHAHIYYYCGWRNPSFFIYSSSRPGDLVA
jgi:hypothetical protein